MSNSDHPKSIKRPVKSSWKPKSAIFGDRFGIEISILTEFDMATSRAFTSTLDGQNLTFKMQLHALRSKLCSARRISDVPHMKMIFIALF